MANKGLQFEHAVMYSAMSRVINKTTQNQKDFDDAAGRYGAIPNDIKQAADRVVETMHHLGQVQDNNTILPSRKCLVVEKSLRLTSSLSLEAQHINAQ